mmetsp:Transcript_38366/g.75323  ORF Transcript_38366/g.75323 Transcript_38366/m.75323 type:complete len:273 (+) Transcript_38366:1651-2469(+)
MPRGEGIRVILAHRREGVVDVAVVGLICSDGQPDVPKLCSLRQLPIVHSNRGCGHVGEQGKVALVHLLQETAVSLHSLLLEVPHESVAEPGRDEIREGVHCKEDALSHQYSKAENGAGFLKNESCHEVHTFVLRLLQQCVDPSVVSLHLSEGVQVSYHRPDHAWHSCNGFKEDDAVQPAPLVQLPEFISGQNVKAKAHHSHRRIRKMLCDVLGFVVGDLHLAGRFLIPHRVGECVGSELFVVTFDLPRAHLPRLHKRMHVCSVSFEVGSVCM